MPMNIPRSVRDVALELTFERHHLRLDLGPLLVLVDTLAFRQFAALRRERLQIVAQVFEAILRDRILLGLPLYGMTWRTRGPDRFAPVVGSGKSWILDGNRDVLLDPEFVPQRDPIEHAEFFVEQDDDTWLHTYYDSPATLRLKLALARDQGFAGGGFWAIGYEQGLPGYLELMADPVKIARIIDEGAERARPIAEATMAEVRTKMGLR